MISNEARHTSQWFPRATYRLQFHRDFPLRRAIDLIPYLDELGVSHLYASPLLKACPGSAHGYDVCDHSQINPELGSEEDLEELATAAHRRGMGIVLDIVPNHMGVGGRENAWWWDVLKNGCSSGFARYFDIDWETPDPRLRGKIVVPILGDSRERVLERGELKLSHDGNEIALCYAERRYPISPATLAVSEGAMPKALARLNADPRALAALLEKQHYALEFWRTGLGELNYRRFFDVPTLAAVRVELPEVFEATHAVVIRWLRAGWIDGLRVDHPDGLANPSEYFQRLRRAAPRAWIIAEKILAPGEALPDDWPVAGTTGYDFMPDVAGLFVDPAAEKSLTDTYAEFTCEPTDYAAIVREKKLLVLRELFAAEVQWLTRLLAGAAARDSWLQGVMEPGAREAVMAVIAEMPVYRVYVQPGAEHVGDAAAELIFETVGKARDRRRDLASEAFDLIEELLLLIRRGEKESEFVVRFQQVSGAAMAKGAEDTAFYDANRLIALNMVGGNPGRFSFSPQLFHERCARAQRLRPGSMLASSTHDTKRSEDVTARIGLLSEIAGEWRAAAQRWRAINDKHRRRGWPDRNMEYFYYQTLVGAWPLSAERAKAVMEKSSKEAKQHTSWLQPQADYDDALRHFVESTLGDANFIDDLNTFLKKLVEAGRINSLGQTLLKLTAPGVPDIYQGTELWEFSLVDPDNRRPVDFESRKLLLSEIKRLSLEEIWRRRDEGLPKLWLIHKTLQFRRREPRLFGGESSYQPIFARGAKSEHVVAFNRGGRAVTIVPRLELKRGKNWGDTRVSLPEGKWLNELTGENVYGRELWIASLLKRFPVALLSRMEAA